MSSPCPTPVPSGQADLSSRAAGRGPWVAGALLVAVAATATWFLVDDTQVVTPPSAQPSAGASTDPAPSSRADAASELLRELTAALEAGTRRGVLPLAAPGEPTARRELAAVLGNVRALGIEDLSMRYVDGDQGRTSPADRRRFGDAAWVADVVLSWRIAGYDEGTSSMEVALTLVDTPDGVAFGSATGDYDAPAPLWLLDELTVARTARALVVVADESDLERYSALVRNAVRDVRAVIPGWRGRLVVQVPASPEQLHRLLDVEPGTYDSIAAVTATVDGSLRASAPVHILVNPEVFAGLGERGSQIVMSHEAAHVAVDAATTTMPLWLLEGFADYVALARTDLPVSVTASQILAEVRRSGPPRALPGADEFDPASQHLGSSYEAAWLACRLIAREYGERGLIGFYEAVDEGVPMEDAFGRLGTTERAFTRLWRGYLRELAG